MEAGDWTNEGGHNHFLLATLKRCSDSVRNPVNSTRLRADDFDTSQNTPNALTFIPGTGQRALSQTPCVGRTSTLRQHWGRRRRWRQSQRSSFATPTVLALS